MHKRLSQLLAMVLCVGVFAQPASIPQIRTPFLAAGAVTNGAMGLVPAPQAGDQTKLLRGDATWVSASGTGDLLEASLLGEFNTTAEKANVASNLWVVSNSEGLARQWASVGHVKFDGVTATQRGTAFIPGFNNGTNDFSVSCILRAPSANPSASVTVACISSSSTTVAAYSAWFFVGTSGELQARLYGSTSGSVDSLRMNFNSFVSTYGGQKARVTWVRSGGTLTLSVNKVSESLALVSGGGGGVPGSFAESINGQYVHIGGIASQPYNDHIISAELFNFALSASEVSELVDFGTLSKFRNWPANTAYGMNQIANQERNSTITSDVGTDWALTGTATVTIDTANNEVDVTVASGSDGAQLAASFQTQLKAGQLHRLTFDVRNFATVTSITASWNGQDITGASPATANGSYSFEFTPTAGIGILAFSGTDVGSFSLANIVLTPVLLTNGSFEAVAADDFTGWTETVTAPGTVTSEETIIHSGTTSAKLYFETAGAAKVTQASVLKVGQRYRATGWFYTDKATALTTFDYVGGSSSGNTTITTDYTGAAINIPATTWTQLTWDFTALQTTFGVAVPTAVLTTKSLYCDDLQVTPLTANVSLSPWGLDPETTLWRNQAGSGDATLFGQTLDAASGRYPNIVIGPGRGFSEEGQLTRIGRERSALMGGGVYLDGNASQRITVSPSTAQDVNTDAFWFQWSGLIPSANPASTAGGLFLISSSATTTAGGCVFAGIDTSGNLEVRLYGSTTSDYRQAEVQNLVSIFGGKVPTIIGCRTATSLLLWINGQQQSYVETVAGTPPTWAADITSTYFHTGLSASGQRWIGDLLLTRFGRGTLTQALVDELTSTGLRSTATASPISRNGQFSATAADGCMIDLDFSIGAGNFFPNRAHSTILMHGYSAHTTHTHLMPKRTGLWVQDKLTWAGGDHIAKVLGNTAVSSGVLLPVNAKITGVTVKTATNASAGGITLGNGGVAAGDLVYYLPLSTALVGYNSYDPTYDMPDGTNLKLSLDPDTANYTGSMNVTVQYDLVDPN